MTTIFKMLDVSMSHVPKSTDDALDRQSSVLNDFLMVAGWLNTGWIIMVPPKKSPDVTTVALNGYSALAAVLARAQKLKCDYVRLNPDGDVLDGLETYDW